MKNEFVPQRLKGESYEDYKVRRRRITLRIRMWRNGHVLHNSATKGTYRKPKVSK